jgi:hypothetical protein
MYICSYIYISIWSRYPTAPAIIHTHTHYIYIHTHYTHTHTHTHTHTRFKRRKTLRLMCWSDPLAARAPDQTRQNYSPYQDHLAPSAAAAAAAAAAAVAACCGGGSPA